MSCSKKVNLAIREVCHLYSHASHGQCCFSLNFGSTFSESFSHLNTEILQQQMRPGQSPRNFALSCKAVPSRATCQQALEPQGWCWELCSTATQLTKINILRRNPHSSPWMTTLNRKLAVPCIIASPESARLRFLNAVKVVFKLAHGIYRNQAGRVSHG